MTRYRFGGDAAAWLIDLVTDPTLYAGDDVVAIPGSDLTVLFYAAQDGSPLSDFLDATSSPLTSIVVPGGTSYLPFFFGPEDLTTLWFQDTNSVWHVLLPSDLGDRMAGAEHDIGDLQDQVADILSAGGGGGGSGVNVIYQQVAGSSGYPANPDPTKPSWWRGPDQPPSGTVAGAPYMQPGDEWDETDRIVQLT